jgi:hypothetical protein
MNSGSPLFQSGFKEKNTSKYLVMNQFVTLKGLIRVYLYKKWKTPKIDLIVNSSKLAQIADQLRKENKDCKVVVELNNEFVNIKKSPFGNALYPRLGREQTTRVSLAKIISLEEKYRLRKLLEKDQHYFTKKVEVHVCPHEWDAEFHEFFVESPQEQELVRELKKKFRVQKITSNSERARKYGNGDITITHSQEEIPIEITIHPPTNREKEIKKGGNALHGQKWSKVAAKILTMLLFSVENKRASFVIIHSDWEKYSHTLKIKEALEKSKCFMIYSSFQNGWEKEASEKIARTLGEEICFVSESSRQPIPSQSQSFQTKEENVIYLQTKNIL